MVLKTSMAIFSTKLSYNLATYNYNSYGGRLTGSSRFRQGWTECVRLTEETDGLPTNPIFTGLPRGESRHKILLLVLSVQSTLSGRKKKKK